MKLNEFLARQKTEAKFQGADEAGKAVYIFWPTPGVGKRTFVSTRFSAMGTLLLASVVNYRRAHSSDQGQTVCACICHIRSDH